jgi:hypothetical protein
VHTKVYDAVVALPLLNVRHIAGLYRVNLQKTVQLASAGPVKKSKIDQGAAWLNSDGCGVGQIGCGVAQLGCGVAHDIDFLENHKEISVFFKF